MTHQTAREKLIAALDRGASGHVAHVAAAAGVSRHSARHWLPILEQQNLAARKRDVPLQVPAKAGSTRTATHDCWMRATKAADVDIPRGRRGALMRTRAAMGELMSWAHGVNA